ncbi:hypothetical protein Pmani_028798 [Petrolisthes manimaculis]|uniref:Uncharacterized protein n=1 Tax=Petrolisthes manimaculis TaxID=1843537 RepID=A0AAE1TVA1_9EUCA|nr:hypothetical protein Pmani_028798 [Petrolisthes manimaculis]
MGWMEEVGESGEWVGGWMGRVGGWGEWVGGCVDGVSGSVGGWAEWVGGCVDGVRGPRALRGQVEELPGAVSPATTTTDSSSRHFTVSSNS